MRRWCATLFQFALSAWELLELLGFQGEELLLALFARPTAPLREPEGWPPESFVWIFTLWVGKKRTRCQRIIQRTCSSLPPAPIPAPCMEVSWGTILSTSPSGSLSLILTNLDPLTEILLFLILLPSVTVTPRHCWHCSPIYYQPEQTQSGVIFSVHSAPCALPSHRRL